jgi:hypothetical protein
MCLQSWILELSCLISNDWRCALANRRGYIGATLWSLGYNVTVALCGLYLGLGVAFVLFSLRHILLGVPGVFRLWGLIVFGREHINRFPPPSQQWPNRHWVISGLIYVGVTAIVLLRFNIRLIDLLIR